MVRRIAAGLAVFFLIYANSSWAADAVRQFSSDFLLNESQQVLQPDTAFRYADPKHGPALRRLLDPTRAKIVVDAYFEENKQPGAPQILNQIQPLFTRYAVAFDRNPSQYEQEYLDVLEWMSLTVFKPRNTADFKFNPSSSMSEEDQRKLANVQKPLNEFLDALASSFAEQLRNKIRSGKFSDAYIQRAADLADRIGGSQNRNASSPPETRKILNGQKVYEAICAICHAAGVVGAPRAGDQLAWAPRIQSGLPSLMRATLQGKGQMFPQRQQGAQGYLDIEIERAVVYLANTGGGRFAEPKLAKGDPGMTTRKIIGPTIIVRKKESMPYASMEASQKMVFGERIFRENCAFCHGNDGRGQGLQLLSLINAPTFSDGPAAVNLVIRGRNAMPPSHSLDDDEITAVINYGSDVFAKQAGELVTPEMVGERRGLKP